VVRPEGLRAATVLTGTINPDLTFRVGGLQAGAVTFSFGSIDASRVKGFTILRVERDGLVQSPGIQVKTGEQVGGVKLVVGYGSGIIRGVVRVENGTLPASARMSVRINKPGETWFPFRPVEVDARGHFLIEGMTAGNYELTVSAYWQGLRNRPPMAHQQISVADGVTSDVEMVLDLKPPDPTPQP
jgi:hypothetical protein